MSVIIQLQNRISVLEHEVEVMRTLLHGDDEILKDQMNAMRAVLGLLSTMPEYSQLSLATRAKLEAIARSGMSL